MKSFKLLFTIALTIFPLTSANQILISVLKTNKKPKAIRFTTSLLLYDGITIGINILIFLKNS